jgi:AGZA family xanthine/uracil permease-like MFS transporter
MSYILLVNPQILGAWAKGTPLHSDYISDLATATALTCGIGCIVTGILSRLPFAVGPGMGLNTLFAGLCVAACQGDTCNIDRAEHSFSTATTTTFFMGLVVLLLSVLNATNLVLLMLPATLKTAIMVGIGAFQAFVGLRWMQVIVPGPPGEVVQLESLGRGGLDFDLDARGNPTSGYAQVLFVFCLVAMSALFQRGIKGSILIAIVLTTTASWVFEIGGGEAVEPFSLPTLARSARKIFPQEWLASSGFKANLSEMAVMFLIVIFDVGGIQFGIGKAIDLPEAKRKAAVEANVKAASEGREVDPMFTSRPTDMEILPGRTGQMVYASVGVCTMLSAALGCSPCIVFLECAAGVREGAKTGIASVVTGLLFLVSSFLTPVFRHVPICASAAPLVFVGCLMMGPVGEIDWNDLNHALPAFLCILMMPFSGSVTWGIVFGLGAYCLMALANPQELLFRWKGGEFVHSVSPPATPGLAHQGHQGEYESLGDEPKHHTPSQSVARVTWVPSSGQLQLVEELVPIESPLANSTPMDDLHRTTRMAPMARSNSVVTKALIGSPH